MTAREVRALVNRHSGVHIVAVAEPHFDLCHTSLHARAPHAEELLQVVRQQFHTFAASQADNHASIAAQDQAYHA